MEQVRNNVYPLRYRCLVMYELFGVCVVVRRAA